MTSSIPKKEIIHLSSIHVVFENGVKALDKIDVNFYENEFVAIVGPSGCGKSTLLRLIAGLLTEYTGLVTVRDMAPKVFRVRNSLAFVFQEPNLLPWRTTIDNVKLPLELQKISPLIQRQKSIQALDLVGLKNFAHAYPQELSGGMKMRASLVRALVAEPQIMLLDEPFAALDEITRQSLNEELLKLWQQKWTTLFVTHNIFEAVFLSSRIIIMSNRPGKILADIKIPFSYPRHANLRMEKPFIELVTKIHNILKETICD